MSPEQAPLPEQAQSPQQASLPQQALSPEQTSENRSVRIPDLLWGFLLLLAVIFIVTGTYGQLNVNPQIALVVALLGLGCVLLLAGATSWLRARRSSRTLSTNGAEATVPGQDGKV